jgi:DNA invertase Pin-like site-specific DNA recombinase
MRTTYHEARRLAMELSAKGLLPKPAPVVQRGPGRYPPLPKERMKELRAKGMKYREIAQIVGCSLSGVSKVLT